ncbi:MAG: thioredoxin domain-containing protein [Gemmatales bacterium]
MAAKNVVELNQDNWQSAVVDSALPVVVDFWAVWCGPCRMIAPHVEALADEYAGKVVVGKVNVDDNQDSGCPVPHQHHSSSLHLQEWRSGGTTLRGTAEDGLCCCRRQSPEVVNSRKFIILNADLNHRRFFVAHEVAFPPSV